MRFSRDCDDCEHQRPGWERRVAEASGSVDSIRSTRRHRRLPMAIWNPRQFATQNIDSERGSHEDSAYPEAPVTMHAPPVRPWIWFASAVTVPFGVVLVSSHYLSISNEHSPLRAVLLKSPRRYKACLAAEKLVRRPFQSTISTIQENTTGSPVNCGQNLGCTLFRNGDVHDCSASADATWKTEDVGGGGQGLRTTRWQLLINPLKSRIKNHVPLKA